MKICLRAQLSVSQAKEQQRQISDALAKLTIELKLRQEELREGNFYAGIDGIVTEMIIDPRQLVGGMQVPYGGLVARIDKPGQYDAVLSTTDTQVARLLVGQRCRVKVVGLEGKPCIIKSIATSPTLAKDGSRRYEVAAQFRHDGPILPRDILGLVDVQVGEPVEVLAVSKSALRSNAGQGTLRAYSDDNGWADVKVDVGRGNGESIQVSVKEKTGKHERLPEIVQSVLSN